MKPSIAPFVSAAIVGLVFTGVTLRMDSLANRSFRTELRARVAERVEGLGSTLEQSLHLHLRTLAAAKAVVLARPVLDGVQVERIGPTLVQGAPAVGNIVFSPSGLASLSYARPGQSLDAKQLSLISAACAARGAAPVPVAGMFVLEPVSLHSANGSDAFWGCVSMALDYATLVAPAKAQLADPELVWSVRTQGSPGAQGRLIAGAARMAAGPVTGKVVFPGGTWDIAAQPRLGWDQNRPYSTPLRLVMLVVVVLGCTGTWTLHARGIRNRQLLRKLEEGEHARRRWVADTSHELRTPITILSTHLDALRDGMIELTPNELEVLSDTVQSMERLVTDLHQLARSDASALAFEYEDVELAELFDELEQAFALRFAQYELTLTLHGLTPGLTVRADRLRLAQVLSNLWSNTLRYTDRGGRAEVTLTHAHGQVCIRCDDTGPGVPDAALARLFERFYRVDASRSRAGGGSGLGLAICQSIVEAHGGQIRASHSALGGVCIDMTLPQGARA
jgi:signal transduction histidine kinase